MTPDGRRPERRWLLGRGGAAVQTIPAGRGGGPVLSDLSKEAPDSLVSGGHDACNSCSKNSECIRERERAMGRMPGERHMYVRRATFSLPAGLQGSGKKETKATTNTSEAPLVRPEVTMFTGSSQGWPGRVHPAVWGKKDRLPHLQGPRRTGPAAPGSCFPSRALWLPPVQSPRVEA